MKLCLVSSPGGHLTEMIQLLDAFNGHDVFLITTFDDHFKRKPQNIRTHFIRNYCKEFSIPVILANALFCGFLGLRILLSENPDVIISNGSEIAVPICYIAKLLGIKIIFIESMCRINDLSGTGKLIYPIADLFLVQWDCISKKFKKAKYWGKVL